jgi:hypothetical protein
MPVRWSGFAKQKDLHPGSQRRCSRPLAAEARIHEGDHPAFAAALDGDLLRRTMCQGCDVGPAPEVRDGLRLRLARQELQGDFLERHEMLAFQVLVQLG